MKILVCIKHVPDTSVKVKISDSNRDIEITSQEMIINPFDEFAIEEALKIKESVGGEVAVLTVGPIMSEEALKLAVAMGSDAAVRVWNKSWGRMEPMVTASVLAEAVKEVEPDLVICGKRATDDNAGQVGIALAGKLEWPHISEINQLKVIDDISIEATKETDMGREIWRTELPAVVTVEKGINQPRYPSMRDRIRANKVPIRVIEGESIFDSGEVIKPGIRLVELQRRPSKQIPKVLLDGTASERLAFILAGGLSEREVEHILATGSVNSQIDQFFEWINSKGLFTQ